MSLEEDEEEEVESEGEDGGVDEVEVEGCGAHCG